ncbi:MAG: hypothetical protein AB7I50_23175 [Vicinamibacterales bacterium]
MTTLLVRNDAALADAAMVASSTFDGREAVGVRSIALERCRMPLVSEAEPEKKSSYWYLANGLPVSRGGRMLILDDQGAETLLAVGFTGVLASWSRRGSPTGWPCEPRRPDRPESGAPLCG